MAECGCESSNCPHKTSEVNLWDGAFNNITVPSGSGLNDVLTLLETYITQTGNSNSVSYTLTSNSSCLGLDAGTYGFTQILDAIIVAACNSSTSESTVTSVNTTEVSLDGIIPGECEELPDNITDSTGLFNYILSKLCVLTNTDTTPTDDPIVLSPPDFPTVPPPDAISALHLEKNAKVSHLSNAIDSLVDNKSFIYEHVSPIVSPTSFSATIGVMKGVVETNLVTRDSSEILTVNATKDTYMYLSGDGTILSREVPNSDPAPTTPDVSHLLYIIVSDGSGITSVTNSYETNPFSTLILGSDDVDTVNIVDDAITTAKMAPVATAATVGYDPLFYIEFNNEGQVLDVVSNVVLSGLTDGQVLTYNSGANRFENSNNTAITSAYTVPVSNSLATAFIDSSIIEDSSQVFIDKKVEITAPGGIADDVATSLLNVNGNGTFILPRVTAVQASTFPLFSGTMVYVTDTDATFTSIGFWGVEDGTWTKL